mgnify:CR=1 FL=1
MTSIWGMRRLTGLISLVGLIHVIIDPELVTGHYRTVDLLYML